MKKLLEGIALGALLVSGFALTDTANDVSLEKEPSVLSIGKAFYLF